MGKNTHYLSVRRSLPSACIDRQQEKASIAYPTHLEVLQVSIKTNLIKVKTPSRNKMILSLRKHLPFRIFSQIVRQHQVSILTAKIIQQDRQSLRTETIIRIEDLVIFPFNLFHEWLNADQNGALWSYPSYSFNAKIITL